MSEWGPWIEHDGRGCPCIGLFIDFHCRFADGEERRHQGWVSGGFGGSSVWRRPDLFVFLRYRIRKPRALEQLREIARNPEQELEDA